jgi:alcohol dehydrogenase, propanol-preferring
MMIRAARMHGYNEPLRLETIPAPEVGPEEVRIKVGGAGMCRTDFQMIQGYFRSALELQFPFAPGHEVSGWVEGIGKKVPRSAGLAEGDQIVVDGGWGDGACRQCHSGDQQVCAHGRWIGFGPAGGYQEYVVVDYRKLIKVAKVQGLTPETLAPLTDAGLTPYRGLKKLQKAGALSADRTLAVMGAGALGVYAVQYAKILGSGATVVALARSDEKLAVAKQNGADHVINTRGRSTAEVAKQLAVLTGRADLGAVIDCAGAEESLQLGFSLLAPQGSYCSVGLVGNKINIPLFPFVGREYTYYGSFWGNYNDLSEVMALAQAGKIKHSITRVKFEDINPTMDALGRGELVGRAVIVYD